MADKFYYVEIDQVTRRRACASVKAFNLESAKKIALEEARSPRSDLEWDDMESKKFEVTTVREVNPVKKWRVELDSITVYRATIEVEAKTEAEAKTKALGSASDGADWREIEKDDVSISRVLEVPNV